MLAALAIVAGPARPVTVAIEVLGRDGGRRAAAPPPAAGAERRDARRAASERKGLLADLQHEVQTQTEVTEVHFAELERVDKKTILMVAVLAGATYFLLPTVRRPARDLQAGAARPTGGGRRSWC